MPLGMKALVLTRLPSSSFSQTASPGEKLTVQGQPSFAAKRLTRPFSVSSHSASLPESCSGRAAGALMRISLAFSSHMFPLP